MTLETTASNAPEARPRVWPVYLVFVLTLAALLVGSIALTLGSLLVVSGRDALSDQTRVMQHALDPRVLLLSISFNSLLLAVVAVGAGALSPETLRERLGLRVASWPVLSLALAIVAAPALGTFFESVLVLLGVEVTGTLKFASESMLRARGWQVPAVIVVVGLGPGIGEELMCRGFVQTRLVARHGPVLGVAVSALLFGILHVDLLQGFLAGLLGVYLGFVALRFGSIVVAMGAHAFNNMVSVALLYAYPDGLPLSVQMVAGALGLLVTILAVIHLQRVEARAR